MHEIVLRKLLGDFLRGIHIAEAGGEDDLAGDLATQMRDTLGRRQASEHLCKRDDFCSQLVGTGDRRRVPTFRFRDCSEANAAAAGP